MDCTEQRARASGVREAFLRNYYCDVQSAPGPQTEARKDPWPTKGIAEHINVYVYRMQFCGVAVQTAGGSTGKAQTSVAVQECDHENQSFTESRLSSELRPEGQGNPGTEKEVRL